MHTRLDLRARQALWGGAFVASLFVPLFFSLGAGGTGNLALELSLAVGIVGGSTLTCTVIAASRMRSLTHTFGIDHLLRAHRWLALVTLGLVLAHLVLVLVADPANFLLLVPWSAPARARAATLATLSLTGLCLLSLNRQRLGTRYESWRWVHVVLGVAAVTGSALHVLFLDHMTQDQLMLRWFQLSLAMLVGVLAVRWVVRPLAGMRHPFVIDELRQESDTVYTLALRPENPRSPGLAFAPGQFAWIRLDRPFTTAEEHPFTIASGAHRPHELEFTIRVTGDFTELLSRLRPGRRVFVDGPYGAFTMDAHTRGDLLLVAGGVGITPMMSMLRTLAHRRDRRPVTLVVAAAQESDLLFREELAELERELELEIVPVVSRPGPTWRGAVGRVDLNLLSTVLPDHGRADRCEVYICGPPGMVDSVVQALHVLGVPERSVHTEQFDMV